MINMWKETRRRLIAPLIGLTLLAGCAPAGSGAATDKSPASAHTAAAVPFQGSLTIQPAGGPPGTAVTLHGTGLPANRTLRLDWNTVAGAWLLDGEHQENFKGRQFKDVPVPLTNVTTDAGGAFTAQFTVPNGWGFDHNVTLADPDSGAVLNRTNFKVQMQAGIHPTSGPPGTLITIDVDGMGYRSLENSWVLLYDNNVTGWISSVTTGGKARVVIPATGAPGKHLLQINHGWSSVAYLNPQQSPAPDRPIFNFDFTITDGPAVLPPPPEAQGLTPAAAAVPAGTGAALWTEPASGSVSSAMTLHGRGLPPGQQLELTWSRVQGNRISGKGWSEASVSLGKAGVAPDGTISVALRVPDDLGGAHTIGAVAGGQTLATGSFTVSPSVVGIEPASGPAGTTFSVHLKGVGWTETANIYTLDYDNAYMGFACGFNSQGDVVIPLRAAGEPGYHFIDLYPAIYKGKDQDGVYNFRYPMLTGDQDHPGERLPILHVAFLVTE